MHVKSLHIYPVKSCRGIDLEASDIRERGLAGDRRAMIVDVDGKFLTQREHPEMAQIIPRLSSGDLSLEIDGAHYSVRAVDKRCTAQVWKDSVEALCVSGEVNEALSQFLNQPVQLVMMDKNAIRNTNSVWAKSQVSFADGYPILVANTASLSALENWTGEAVSMAQFRPNIVVETHDAWAEDEWRRMQIGDVIVEMVKPCTRCVMTTLDPLTGKNLGDAVMQAMVKYRQSPDPRNKGVVFGQNAIVNRAGNVRVGDQCHLI